VPTRGGSTGSHLVDLAGLVGRGHGCVSRQTGHRQVRTSEGRDDVTDYSVELVQDRASSIEPGRLVLLAADPVFSARGIAIATGSGDELPHESGWRHTGDGSSMTVKWRTGRGKSVDGCRAHPGRGMPRTHEQSFALFLSRIGVLAADNVVDSRAQVIRRRRRQDRDQRASLKRKSDVRWGATTPSAPGS